MTVPPSPYPERCQKCRKFKSPRLPDNCGNCKRLGYSEEILCHLNRSGQEKDEFLCFAFEPMIALVPVGDREASGQTDSNENPSTEIAGANGGSNRDRRRPRKRSGGRRGGDLSNHGTLRHETLGKASADRPGDQSKDREKIRETPANRQGDNLADKDKVRDRPANRQDDNLLDQDKPRKVHAGRQDDNLLDQDKLQHVKEIALEHLRYRDRTHASYRKYHLIWNVSYLIPAFTVDPDTFTLVSAAFAEFGKERGLFADMSYLAADHVHVYLAHDGRRSLDTLVKKMQAFTQGHIMGKYTYIRKRLGPDTDLWSPPFICREVG